MSFIKRYLDSMCDPDGIDASDDLYVSAACFEEPAIKRFIRENLVDRPCSYYRGDGLHPKGAPLATVVRFFFAGFCSRFEDAANGVGWEGEYVGAKTYDSYDLVFNYVEIASCAGNDLFSDLIRALPDRVWSAIDPYASRQHEIYAWSWDSFVETVKHKRRYFFDDTNSVLLGHEITPRQLLESVTEKCKQARLIRTLSAGTTFFRCRERLSCEPITKPIDLGPPPHQFASQSRMSPAGVPMFYGAYDEATARAETLGSHGDRHTMATFALSKSIRILDLTRVPAISIFDQRRSGLYDWAIFMRQFVRDFGKKIERDNRIHFDYVPTQIVTEYFRAFMRDSKGTPIAGVMYRSTKTGSNCVVLFMDQDDVAPRLRKTFDPQCAELLQMVAVTQHKRKRLAQKS